MEHMKGNTMKRFSTDNKKILVLLAFLAVSLASCTDWERNTFQTLSASKAVIEQAGDDYNNKKIQQTKEVYAILLKAGAIHNTANQAFLSYKKIKDAGANSTQLNAAIAEVNAAIQQLPGIIAKIKAIQAAGNLPLGIGNPPAKPTP
jgi:predicted negative regulator of RcsB-dependent stress response